MKFKIGDKVKLTTHKYGDYQTNPIWNGTYGKTKGKIIEIGGYDRINVEWENGNNNCYFTEDLEKIKEKENTNGNFTNIGRELNIK